MTRFSSNDIIEIGRLTSGTSAAFIGYNTKTGKKGIYKENGCMLGITNDDIREKLASDILNIVGVDTANIDLVYDENTKQNACFSNYIIEDNETLVAPPSTFSDSFNQDKVEHWCNNYIDGIKTLSTDASFLKDCKQNFYNYIFMSCIIDSYDIKTDNLPVVLDTQTNKYKTCAWFDFGTAFTPTHKSPLLAQTDCNQLLTSLYENHYDSIKGISSQVISSLNTQNLDLIFSSDYLVELGEDEINNIKARLASQIEKVKELELSKNKVSSKETNKFKNFFTSFKNKLSNMFSRTKKLPDSKQQIEQENSHPTRDEFSKNLSSLVNDEITEATYVNKTYPPPEL